MGEDEGNDPSLLTGDEGAGPAWVEVEGAGPAWEADEEGGPAWVEAVGAVPAWEKDGGAGGASPAWVEGEGAGPAWEEVEGAGPAWVEDAPAPGNAPSPDAGDEAAASSFSEGALVDPLLKGGGGDGGTSDLPLDD